MKIIHKVCKKANKNLKILEFKEEEIKIFLCLIYSLLITNISNFTCPKKFNQLVHSLNKNLFIPHV